MKAKTISWLILVFLGFGILVPYGLLKFGMYSTFRMIRADIELDIQAAKQDGKCSQDGILDSISKAKDPNIWTASPKRMYWKTFILHDSAALRTESSPIFSYVSRHYLTLLRDRGKVKRMAEWHLRGMLLLLTLEEKLTRSELVQLACLFDSQKISNK